MSLSNWDALAIDENGVATDGAIERDGRCVSVYKNWLYLQDVRGWSVSTGYANPTVGEVHAGNRWWGGFSIYAERGPQNGVYALVAWRDYEAKTFGAMLTCGVYGCDDGDEWVGATPASAAVLVGEFLDRAVENGHAILPAGVVEKMRNGERLRFCQGDGFSGRDADEPTCTPPGEAAEPWLSALLGG